MDSDCENDSSRFNDSNATVKNHHTHDSLDNADISKITSGPFKGRDDDAFCFNSFNNSSLVDELDSMLECEFNTNGATSSSEAQVDTEFESKENGDGLVSESGGNFAAEHRVRIELESNAAAIQDSTECEWKENECNSESEARESTNVLDEVLNSELENLGQIGDVDSEGDNCELMEKNAISCKTNDDYSEVEEKVERKTNVKEKKSLRNDGYLCELTPDTNEANRDVDKRNESTFESKDSSSVFDVANDGVDFNKNNNIVNGVDHDVSDLEDTTNNVDKQKNEESNNNQAEEVNYDSMRVDKETERTISPTITMMDCSLLEENLLASCKLDSAEQPSTSKESDRDNKLLSPNLEEMWEYEEGAELTPSTVHGSIVVPENVLKVVPEELNFYKNMFAKGVESVLRMRLHCTSCGQHIGASPNYLHTKNRHKVLRVLVCNRCEEFYGPGVFVRDEDGSELYCRWCGQGGAVVCCSHCPNVFCLACLKRNLGPSRVKYITELKDWSCLLCNYKDLWHLRAICWALLSVMMKQKRDALTLGNVEEFEKLSKDQSVCCAFPIKKNKMIPPKSSLSAEKPVKKLIRPPAQKTHSSLQKKVQQKITKIMETENYSPEGHFLSPMLDTLGFDNHCQDQEQEPEHFEEPSNQEDNSDDGDYLDPSFFVQPVLEDTSPVKTVQSVKTVPAPRRNVLILPSTASRNVKFGRGSHSQPSSLPSTSFRLINPVSSVQPPPLAVPTHPPPLAPAIRPNISLNNLDGARSMYQIENLNSCPWFRDAIDDSRSTGHAIVKRLRDIERRFHSLKNKNDIEKVLTLGKKIENMMRTAQLRYEQLSEEIKDNCKIWLKNQHYTEVSEPFKHVNEVDSDWDDEIELSQPLQKVMIPVKTTFHGPRSSNGVETIRISNPVSLAKPNPPPLGICRPTIVSPLRTVLPANRFPVPSLTRFPSLIRPIAPRLVNGFSQNQQCTPPMLKQRSVAIKRPGPASTAVVNCLPNPVTTSVISVSQKRPRSDVDDDSGDDVDDDVVLETPPTKKEVKVRPCSVSLERCDKLVPLFSKKKEHNVSVISVISTSEDDDEEIQIIEEKDPLEIQTGSSDTDSVNPAVFCETID